MSDLGRKTKAELLTEVGELREQLKAALAEAKNKPAAPERIAEAAVLAACIRAMNELRTRERYSGSSYETAYRVDHEPIDRVLRHLASLYGIALHTVELRDCDRPHIDQIDYTTVQNALAAGVRR